MHVYYSHPIQPSPAPLGHFLNAAEQQPGTSSQQAPQSFAVHLFTLITTC